MKFPVVICKSENTDYGAWLPDFPGCYPLSSTLDGLLTEVQSAVEEWMEGQEPDKFPVPSSLDDILKNEDAKGQTILLVDVDTSFLDTTTQRINITMPRYALNIIDKAAKKHGLTRSGFLVEAAKAYA